MPGLAPRAFPLIIIILAISLEAHATVLIPISEVWKLRLWDLHSLWVVELRFEPKESGSRKGCVYKGESIQRQETYSGTHMGPAISLPLHPPHRSADLDMAETKRIPRENTGTLELVFHGITPQPSTFRHAPSWYRDFKASTLFFFNLLNVYR